MDCIRITELLSEYIDDMLSDDLKKEVESHIHTCVSCRQEYDMLKAIVDSCHKLDEIDLPDDFHQKLHNRLIEENVEIKRENSFKYKGKRYTAIAAVLVLVVSLSVAINSGILNLGSSKKAESAKGSDTVQSKEFKKDAAAAPEYTIRAEEEKNELKAASKAAEARDQSSEAATTSEKRMVYHNVTVNLDQSQYKKYYENIGVIIEGFGGYLKQKELLAYMIPEKNLDAFIKKMADGYDITNISVDSEDITDEYTKLQQEIAELENRQQKQASPGDNGNDAGILEDSKSIIVDKRNELQELSSKAEYAYIQIIRK